MSTSPKPKHTLVPKYIKDELRMLCAVRGYDMIKQGPGMNVNKQRDAMYEFFHGNSTNKPSQVEILASGVEGTPYADLFGDFLVSSSDSEVSSVVQRKLKNFYSQDNSSAYFCGVQIQHIDLRT